MQIAAYALTSRYAPFFKKILFPIYSFITEVYRPSLHATGTLGVEKKSSNAINISIYYT